MSEAVNPIFERVVVVNLDRRPDRWAQFQANLAAVEWPFLPPVRFRAVDGQLSPPPARWISGPGAWGCMQSHRRILEDCLLDKVGSVLVLEDDAYFPPDFPEKVALFLSRVPDDWECLMLGGQHIRIERYPPPLIARGVVRCVNCQRTHAYALKGAAIRDLLQEWSSWKPGTTGHCDHIMGPFMGRRRTYAPASEEGIPQMLVAQDFNQSDIAAGKQVRRTFWTTPAEDLKIVLLQSPSKPDFQQQRKEGLHGGYWIDPLTGMDNGLRDIFGAPRSREDRIEKLKKWVHDLKWEAASINCNVLAWLGPYASAENDALVKEVAGGRFVEKADGE